MAVTSAIYLSINHHHYEWFISIIVSGSKHHIPIFFQVLASIATDALQVSSFDLHDFAAPCRSGEVCQVK